jgi:hypothetical protein
MNLLIVGASEITARIQLLHSKKEIDIAAEYILKRAMPITDFSHQHAASFFKDLSLNQTWIIHECGQRLLSADNFGHGSLVAFRTKGGCLSRQPQWRH